MLLLKLLMAMCFQNKCSVFIVYTFLKKNTFKWKKKKKTPKKLNAVDIPVISARECHAAIADFMPPFLFSTELNILEIVFCSRWFNSQWLSHLYGWRKKKHTYIALYNCRWSMILYNVELLMISLWRLQISFF